ncbi:MAG: MmcQ/YjbR family DNA-binding protein [Atopobiaceae bacterium]|nr:MmcQ/YjbR family DNA-binding protein [Atopobiaceae bacterium]
MTLDELGAYVAERYGAVSDHSFKEDVSVTVYSRPDNRKWFAAAKNVGRRSVDAGSDGRIDILNVKLNPREVAALRSRDGFRPAWRMNQNSWVTILLDGTVSDDEVYELVDKAFALAGKGGRR